MLALHAVGIALLPRLSARQHRQHAIELRDRGYTVIPDAGIDPSLIVDAKAACLAEQSMEVDRRKIQLDEPLKQLGDHIVPIKVHREVTAKVTVRIVKEGATVGDTAAAAVAGETEKDTASLDDA